MNHQPLAWRCRRGLRELELPLRAYLDHDYPTAPPEEQQAFERLLEESDERLWRYCFQSPPTEDATLARLIQRLRRAAASHPRILA